MNMSLKDESTFQIWVYAFASVIIISVCGLVPIICMPRLQKTKYQNDLLQFLIGLAIGTLTADALLHLLPISGSGIRHGIVSTPANLVNSSHHLTSILDKANLTGQPSNSSIVSSNDHIDYEDSGRREHSEPLAQHHHHHNDPQAHEDHSLQRAGATGHHHDHHDDGGFWFGFMALVGIIGFLVLERIMVLLTDICTHKEHTLAPTTADSEQKEITSLPMTDPHLHDHQNHHQHQHHHLTDETKSFMFMIITGDGLHNFFDGIAIGVSYGSSLAVGLSTSIAILCHELPHEIGDFAVLIKSGMSIRRAVLYNTLSSILCLLGATTGVFIGKFDVGWVSALIAGMFLYISLVDMVPQLDCYPGQPPLKRARKLLIQLSGIAGGVAIMGLIATYESRLHSLFSNYNHH